jgi:hypothetical protein
MSLKVSWMKWEGEWVMEGGYILGEGTVKAVLESLLGAMVQTMGETEEDSLGFDNVILGRKEERN